MDAPQPRQVQATALNSDSLLPVQPNEFLPPIGRWAIFGGIVMLASFAGAIALAAVLKYPTTVQAPVVIRPTGELRLIQAATTGTVNRIDVKVNQTVQQGQSIAVLDDSRLSTQKRQLTSSIQQTQRQLEQLNAQVQAMQTQIAAEQQATQRVVAAAEAERRLNQRDHQERQVTTRAEVREAEAAVKLAREELARYQELAHTGAVAQLQISEKQAALEASLARLQSTQASLNPSTATIDMTTEKIAQERAKGNSTLATLQQEREALIQQQVKLQNELTRDRQELQQVETDLTQTVIRSPTTGIIQQLNLRNRDQLVQAGDLIAQIAPSREALVIKAYVAPPDIGQVEKGQSVSIKVSSCPYPDYGILAGKVTAISPDAATPPVNTVDAAISEQAQPRGNAQYEIMIQSSERSLRSYDHTCQLQPGMDGNADIVTRQETVLLFLLRKARLLIRA